MILEQKNLLGYKKFTVLHKANSYERINSNFKNILNIVRKIFYWLNLYILVISCDILNANQSTMRLFT